MPAVVHISILVLCAAVASKAAAPIAPHLNLQVDKNGMVEVSLQGSDVDGDDLEATVLSLPAVGQLHQLSQVYSDYGYEPRLGRALSPADLPARVTGSRNRIIYVPPPNTNSPLEKWGTFTYRVSDGYEASEPGIVWLLPPSGRIVFSSFQTSTDGWSVASNGASEASKAAGGLLWEPYARSSISQYVLATDAEVHQEPSSGVDRTLWKLQAPTKFMGNHVGSYGGKLFFTASSLAGDYSSSHLNNLERHVFLECSTCDSGAGVRLAAAAPALNELGDGVPRLVSIALQPSSWVQDPKNSILPWTVPSECTLVEVLSGISGFYIVGDATSWYESVAFDDIGLEAGSGPPLRCSHVYY